MKKILDNLQLLYHTKAKPMHQTLEDYAKTLPKLKRTSENPYWYKYTELYCVYPDSVLYDKTVSPLRNLLKHIDYIKKLGCNALHILPFLASPLVDRGFDVSDYYKVRKNLGTFRDLFAVKKAADKAGIRIFMDLVFNHVSEQHTWFKQAQQGSKKYRDYFISSKKAPTYLGKFHKNSAVWAKYQSGNKIVKINIAFPEQAGEIPHWRQGRDGCWYYHTYYPQQIDLNWLNSEVFTELAKVMMYWTSLGFHFRFDAIPFIGKSAYKFTDINHHYTHLIVATLKCIAEKINPEVAFIAETYEKLTTVINYFGTDDQVQADLSYNFHLSTNLWVSLIKQDANFLWKILSKQSNIPQHAEWLNFLRNHDELSLAYLNNKLSNEVKLSIVKFGRIFREGYGVSGRTFSLLGGGKKKFLMVYFLLASFPGGIVIPYGDEIAAKNIPMHKLSPHEQTDTRNINRGVLSAKEFRAKKARKIFNNIASIIGQRKHLREYLNVWPKRLSAPKNIYAACYKLGSSELTIYVNLSNITHEIVLELADLDLIASVNSIKLKQDAVILGPYAGIWLKK